MPTAAGLYYTVFEGGQVDQPPVVLIHGAGGTCLSWPAEVRRLPNQRVFALDLPGHGRSTGFAAQSIPAYAHSVHDFITQLGLSEAVLIGHSMGGAVALAATLIYPRMVAGLGLISTGASLSIDRELVNELSNPVTIEAGLQRLRGQAFSPASSPALVEACMRPLRETRPSLLLADWTACAAFDVCELVESIAAPACILTGADDRITPPAAANYLAARLPAAQVQIIPAAGHMLLQEQPGAVAAGLETFLQEQLPAIQRYCWNMLRGFWPVPRRREE